LYGKLLYQNSDKFEEDIKKHGKQSILIFGSLVPFVLVFVYFMDLITSIITFLMYLLVGVLIFAFLVVTYRYTNRLRFQIYEMGLVLSGPFVPFIKFREIARLYVIKNFREGHTALIIQTRNNRLYQLEENARPNVVEQVENFQEAFRIIKEQLLDVHKGKPEKELVKYIRNGFEIEKVKKTY
jgi:hypothetical protein